MKAAVLHEQHMPLVVEEIDISNPEPGEIRVRMVGGGVCHSDYHRIDGHSDIKTLPFVMGHEGSGIVTEIGDGVSELSAGDHVVFSLTPQCGYCQNCSLGKANLCNTYGRGSGVMHDGTTRMSKDGIRYYHGLATFSEETIILASSAVKVRKDVPLEKLCLIGCGVMTGVGAVINRAKVKTGSTVAIFGCGGVGLNVVQGAKLAAASKIIVIDKVDLKLEMAREMGATHFINASTEDPVKSIMNLTKGGVDYAFEVIGFPHTIRQAFDSVVPGGTAVMVGVPPERADISIPGRSLFLDRTLMGTFYGAARPRVDFPWLIDLYVDGRLKLDELITKYRPLEEVNEAFNDMNEGISARTVLTFS